MYGRRDVDIQLSSFEDGLNTTSRPTDVGKAYLARYPRKQCADSLNVFLHTLAKRPCVNGFATPAGVISGLHNYLRVNGNEYLLTVYGGVLYSINKSTGAATQLYNFGSSGEAWMVDWADKCWVLVAGVGMCKVEGTTASRVGLAAPTGVTAVASAGAGLPDGVYKIYVSYARKVSGSNVLYSQGQAISDVTLGTGNNRITFTFANSSDSQVNNKVVWMTDAGGTTYYFYYETDNNTTTSFIISSSSAKVEALLYTTQAAYNYLPSTSATAIHVHNKKLHYAVNNQVYYSIQEGSVYDLERFDTRSTGRVITYPYNVESMFTIGADLYINTPGGIIRQPKGDPFAQYEIVSKGYLNEWYKYPRTVLVYSGLAIGLTSDGVRAFDGQKMYAVDFAQDVKPDIKRLYSSYTSTTRPCAAVYRRSDRTEYHLGYYDTQVGGSVNNRRLIMNLDQLGRALTEGRPAAWEKHDTGANYMTVDASGTLYSAQCATAASVIYKDSDSKTTDANLYILGVLQTANIPLYRIRSGSFFLDLRGRVTWNQIRAIAERMQNYTIAVQIVEDGDATSTETITPPTAAGGFILDVGILDTDRLQDILTDESVLSLPASVRGRGVYVEVGQRAEDKSMRLLELAIYGKLYRSVYT